MRYIVSLCGLAALVSGAVVLDRVAVVVGNHAIKSSDIDRDVRITEFLNGAPLNITLSAKREAAERLITQELIRQEITAGLFKRPPDSQAADFEAQLLRDRFGNSQQRLQQALQNYGLSEAQLRQQLLWQLTVLQFIDARFHAEVVVTDEDVRTYYEQHTAELRREHPSGDTLAALTPKIRTLLENQRTDQNFNDWLDQTRKNARVEYKPGAFE